MSVPQHFSDHLVSGQTPRHAAAVVCERPEADALTAIRGSDPNLPILVDFDQTLFLQNSTEAYFQSLRPRILAILLLKLLDFVRPWMLLGARRGNTIRDWVRVVCLSVLFPWGYWLWRRRCKQLARQYENRALADALAEHPHRQTVIASNGFDFIIRPLLMEMTVPWKQLIACGFWSGFKDRCDGKTKLVQRQLGEKFVTAALLVTDSRDDQNLLETVGRPFLVTWESAERQPQDAAGYLPFYYMERVKKPNTNFFFREILIENLLPMVLLLSWNQSDPLIHAVGLGLMWFSFLCVYEMGYMENDLIASQFERTPTLATDHEKHRSRIDFYRPWLWALALAVPGLWLWQLADPFGKSMPGELPGQLPVQWSQLGIHLGLWGAFLLATRVVFCVYNHINERSRTWLYPVLQMMKFVGLLMFTPASVLAWVYLGSMIYARWIPYIVYRYGKLATCPDFPIPLMQCLGMAIVLIPLKLWGGIYIDPWQLGLLLPIVVCRAGKNIIDLVREVRPLRENASRKIGLRWFIKKLFP